MPCDRHWCSAVTRGGLATADVPARLPIDRVFTVKGFGTVVTGTLWSGSIVPETELTLWPAGAAPCECADFRCTARARNEPRQGSASP